MVLRVDGFTGLIALDEAAPETQDWIKRFSCGTASLDNFLRNEADDLHQDHLNRTSLLFHEEFEGLVGFVTLTNDSIPLTPYEIGELGLNYECPVTSFPSIKICRLGVHAGLQRQGIGERIVQLVMGGILAATNLTTARFLITDAINDQNVIDFYQKQGFVESYWAKGKRGNSNTATIKMLRDIYA
jgi:ribosomal protein S18 acetylase RimI-like enzyme